MSGIVCKGITHCRSQAYIIETSSLVLEMASLGNFQRQSGAWLANFLQEPSTQVGSLTMNEDQVLRIDHLLSIHRSGPNSKSVTLPFEIFFPVKIPN